MKLVVIVDIFPAIYTSMDDYASVNSSSGHAPTPGPNPRALAFLKKKLGKFPGVGTPKLSKRLGVGTKKEGKYPAPGIVTFQHFHRFFY